ncbi:hypothetical protein LTR78_004835 [Recurvomyces mirabilis]|uniref:BHLH domain-containing protein n=1 Tax=Recurvomyces mirabilis TaxID=574656 RepID=A0AAE0WPE4_9PEZI|nr:hypothetical protein LTR78_004835 [Recurvomyces mirabilis]KAK5158005.1 hypothetical protein LTS14_003928 [Recurvomyces mirabilis]
MASMTNSDLNDLESLFEFGDLDLQPIPDVSTGQYGDHMAPPQNLSHPSTPFADISSIAPPPGTSAQDFGGQEQYGMQQDMDQQQAQFLSRAGSTVPVSHPFTTQSMYQPSLQQQYHMQPPQYAYTQPQVFPGGHVPPTPNSFDMHGEAGRFMQQQIDAQQRAMLEQQRYQLRKDDAIAFTPMVSPAGTPQYHVQPEFAVPGAYFSPLTSPMLHAQNVPQQQAHHQGYYTNPSTAPSSNAASPIDPSADVDMMGDIMTLPESATSKLKKPRRKVATPRSIATNSRLRQSPATKPQKRKSGTMLSSVVPASELDTIMAESQRSAKSQPSSAGLQMPSVFNGSSEDGSISPEPLSESLMGPPPRPGSSVTQSPALSAQQQEAKAAAAGAAATPKSLLSGNAANQQINGSASTVQNNGEAAGLDDLQLPEAASGQASQRPALTQIDTQLVPETMEDQTPRITARKTPKLGPLSTPSSARPLSAVASPSGMMSPMSATTPGGLLKDKKGDAKGVRSNKKRGSVSTIGAGLPSPALRPRISPSIKPLLPEGTALHSPTHALLLASKSNYQNILEGNHLPGISYPDSLSSGLTSKRTSHKVAEQGRRNRINDALKEMQALVPREYLLGSKKGGSNSEDSPEAICAADLEIKDGKDDAKSHSSKASTVESANVYIRNMQKKQAEEAAENDLLRQRLEELERRLGNEGGSGVDGTAAAVGSAKDSASPDDVKA